MGGFLSLQNALSGVLANRRAIDVVSQNVANASDENYARQSVELRSAKPVNESGLVVGTGTVVGEITRATDALVEARYRTERRVLGEFSQLSDIYQQIESILNEPSEEGLRGLYNEFNAALQSLANDPENIGARQDVVGAANRFSEGLKRVYTQLQQLGGEAGGSTASNSADQQIQTILRRVNDHAGGIARLNQEIRTLSESGGQPNDLLDQRLRLVNELAEFIDVQTTESPSGYRVNVAGYTLVQGTRHHQLEYGAAPDGERRILYDDPTQSVVRPHGGRLKALLDVRNRIIPHLSNELDRFTVDFVDRFNDLHESGFGLGGQRGIPFWEHLPSRESGIFRLEGVGADPSGSIEQQRAGFISHPNLALLGDPSTPEPENFETDLALHHDPTGRLQVNDTVVAYDLREDSLRDVIDRINEADVDATAYLSPQNRLVLKATRDSDFTLRTLRDSGHLLRKTHLIGVGGSDRTGSYSVEDPTLALLDAGGNLDGDERLDRVVGGVDLATGSLRFETSEGNDFMVGYDAREDSLQDLVQRINSEAQRTGTRIAARVTPEGELRLYGAQTPPNSTSDPTTPPDSTLSFRVWDREPSRTEDLTDSVAAGQSVTASVSNASSFEVGDRVRLADDAGSETSRVTGVDEGAGRIVLDEVTRNYTGIPGGEGTVEVLPDLTSSRNLLTTLGVDALHSADTEGEFVVLGRKRRPPQPHPTASLTVAPRIQSDPGAIAARHGRDPDRDGVGEAPRGPGDGGLALELADLRNVSILHRGRRTPQEQFLHLTTEVGNEAARVEEERRASDSLVHELKNQRQEVSGVNLDEELTKLVRHQQAFQASTRVLSVVREMTDSLLRVL